jgi:ATP-binding cassette subfamily B protein
VSAIQEQDFSARKVNFKTWRKILGYAAENKKYIIIAVGFGMLTGILDLCTNYVSMWAIDGFITPKTTERMPLFIVTAILIQFCFGLFTLMFVQACGKLEAHLSEDIRREAFSRLQTMSFSYFDKTPVGYLVTRLTNDVSRATETISWCFIDVGWGTMSIVASLIGMFLVNVKLSLIILASMPAMVLISIVFQKQILKHQRETRRINSMITSSFNEGIMGARTTKTLVREELNNREMFKLTGNMRRASLRAVMISALYMPVASLIISVAVGIVLNTGGFYVLGGYITIGELNFFITIIQHV